MCVVYKSGEMAVNGSVIEVWESAVQTKEWIKKNGPALIVDCSLLETWNIIFQNFSQKWNFGKDLPVVAHCKEDLKSEKSFQASH